MPTNTHGWSPYDVADLAKALGGNVSAVSRLNTFFTELNESGTSEYASMGNEPGEEVPWEYNFVGDPAGTQSVVRRVQTQLFGASPTGLPGNNDGGAISSWYVFSAMGFYPEIPGVGGVVLGSPMFPNMVINLENGKQIRINGTNASQTNPYVQSMTVNGAYWSSLWVPFDMLNAGASLDFVLGDVASEWSSAPTSAPPSFGPNSNPQRYEAESLTVAAYFAPDYRIVSDTSYSGGKAVILDANAVGDSITFSIPNIPAGTYDVRVGVKEHPDRGAWQLSIGRAGGTTEYNIGAPRDEYNTSSVFTEYDLGGWSPAASTNEWFKFAITGKNTDSSGYVIAIDYISLIPES